MKRWNGWGEESVQYPLPTEALEFLEQKLGPAVPIADATLEEVVPKVPASGLAAHPLVHTDPALRLRHARGQSLGDWIDLRSGDLNSFPDGVAEPSDEDEVCGLMHYAQEHGVQLIPYGGGTSVVGHLTPIGQGAPVLTVSMARLRHLHGFDERNHLATFGAGITGPALEAQLRPRGFTLGHYPQSFEHSTLGGWIATRSSGQESAGYGRIEQLFAGGRIQTLRGALQIAPYPASAAGPDLREVVLGSEGRMGIITEATVRVRPLPAQEVYHAVFFPDWETGVQATRTIAQARLGYSMLRLSTPTETESTLAMAGHPLAMQLLRGGLTLWGAGASRCMLLIGFMGRPAIVRESLEAALSITAQHKGIHIGRLFGAQWIKNRFRAPYLRNSLWEAGYAIDTLETATTWDRVPQMVHAIESALRPGLESLGERVHVFTHLSHLYPTGSSIYTSYILRVCKEPEELRERWRRLKAAASQAIVKNGGTITHQHGVGLDHKPYMLAEKGKLGAQALWAQLEFWDRAGILNPGKLLDNPSQD